ncbi:hypothetical protein Nepgr_027246 [Nepenthes gracilis]|uniref:Uncharacterized protein n=1 Tax=Nepenthes gracilis TaxID=150966 RepID=A0AAD3TA12_NEPGR|nr:hypothetical protein Nepgr_027246 [Nepenthes gracilis]
MVFLWLAGCWSSPGRVLVIDALCCTIEVVLNSFAQAMINLGCVMVSVPDTLVEVFLLRGISGLVTRCVIAAAVLELRDADGLAGSGVAVGGAIVPILLLAEASVFTQLIALAVCVVYDEALYQIYDAGFIASPLAFSCL